MANLPDFSNPVSGHRDNLDKIVRVGLALSAEKDIDRLLEGIVSAAQEITGADGVSLYILNEKKQLLEFKILNNNTLDLHISGKTISEASRPPPIPLFIDGAPNHSNVAAHVVVSKAIANIPDIYNDQNFDFRGAKKYDSITGYQTRSMLVIPMENHEKKVIGVLQLLNPQNGVTGEGQGFSEEIVGIVSALASQAAVSLTNSLLIKTLGTNLAKIQNLRKSETQLHEKLREAFQSIDKKNTELQTALKRVRMVRYKAAVLLVVLAVGGFAYSGGLKILPEGIRSLSAQKPPIQDFQRTAVVRNGPVSSSITMTGTLEPLKSVHLISPLDGTVKSINFQYGGLVDKGQTLLTLKATKLEMDFRSAKSDYLKAQDEYEKLEQWSDSLEIIKARRDLNMSKLSMEKAKREYEHSQGLYQKDIISLRDLESAKQQMISSESSYMSSQEQLESTFQKGNEKNLTIVRHRLENSRLRLKEAEEKLQSVMVAAPVSGIILNTPVRAAGGGTKRVDIGSTVKASGLLFTIGDLSGFSISAQVDEADVGKVKEGQPVLVTGDAFPGVVLKGKIQTLSSQASNSSSGMGGSRPSFGIKIVVENVPSKLKKKIKIGMSANLEILTYQNNKALLLPVDAVQMMGGVALVKQRSTKGTIEQKEVQVGYTTLDSAEILKGLNEGDTVVY